MLGRPEIAMGSRGHICVPGARGVAKGMGEQGEVEDTMDVEVVGETRRRWRERKASPSWLLIFSGFVW